MKNRIPLKDDWTTPKDFLKELEKGFGKMFDPCPLHSKFDGLKIEWKKVNFINPPYSRKLKEAFIRKAFEESKKGKTCVMLLPVSTSTKIFHEIIYPNAEIRFIKGRLKFNGLKTSGQMDNMLVIFRYAKENTMNKKVHISIVANEDESTNTSFYFGGATVAQLSMLNHELDILKQEIIDRLKEAPKNYEVEEYDDERKMGDGNE